jgi:hypothetical protein
MKKFITSIILISGFYFLMSCEKVVVIDLLPIDYLTAGNIKQWKLVEYKENDVDLLSDCLKDDIFTFVKSTSKYDWNIGQEKCFADDKNQSFDFVLDYENKILKVNGFDYTLLRLDVDVLEIQIQLSANTIYLKYERL